MFRESVGDVYYSKRFMLLLFAQEEHLELVDFDVNLASDKLKDGLTVVPFWCDRLLRILQDNLQYFVQQ